jgi:putative nucleotidyltransferase with HDIG domain
MTERPHSRHAQYEDLLRRFAAALRAAQLYAPGHPLVARNVVAFANIVDQIFAEMPTVVMALVADEVVVGNLPMTRGAAALGDLFAKLKARGIERVSIDKGATVEELVAAIGTLSRRLQSGADPNDSAWPDFPHVRVGLVRVEPRTRTTLTDMAAVRALYSRASTGSRTVWESAASEGVAEATEARAVVDELAQAVSQNRHSLSALTNLRGADEYTFTHMVNVSILAMVQARGLGIDGTLLREIGVAGLMHDIGKTRTPLEILQKPGRLDHDEMTVMRRHVVDGAEILSKTRDLTPLAAVVAFEHHLRLDGSGYPAGVVRPSLNLATMLCTIADVYDAMRSKRQYQGAFAAERILAVLKHGEGKEFEPNLVRRFVQLMGLYPAGSLVTLNTGECAVVMRPHEADPHRPRVRVVFDANGQRVASPYDVNLWDVEPAPQRASSVSGPASAPDQSFDPLSVM